LNIRRHCVEDLQHEIVSLNYGQKITGCPLNKPVLNLQRNKVHRRFSSAAENNLRQRRPVIRTVRYVERDNYKSGKPRHFVAFSPYKMKVTRKWRSIKLNSWHFVG